VPQWEVHSFATRIPKVHPRNLKNRKSCLPVTPRLPTTTTVIIIK